MKNIVTFLFVMMMVMPNGRADEAGPRRNGHVIIISFDGLRPDAIAALGAKSAPHFSKVIAEGAATLNARTDPDKTITMPNHTCMITGRGVLGAGGHEYVDNRSTDRSIHENKGAYINGIFDVVKEHGLRTGFFASKLKFQVFVNSYGRDGGAYASRMDVQSVTDYDEEGMLDLLLKLMDGDFPQLTFVHFAGTDKAGHKFGWDLSAGSKYLQAVQREDAYLGRIVQAVEGHPALADSTVIIITADHGGIADDHDDVTKMENYRIPFIIWGKGVARGVDLYKINTEIRKDPAEKQVPYAVAGQPIRNGDAANCALSVLGLPPIPGSTIGNPDAVRISEQ